MSAVLAQDADRITRKATHRLTLDEEAERHGARWLALDDWGDDSHEGKLLRFMKGWQAESESLKIRERSRRGTRRKVSEGRLLASSPRPRFGFRYRVEDGERVGYEVDEPKMAIVRRIFSMLADGHSINGTARTLDGEGVPTPRGGLNWSRRTIIEMAREDVYRPRAVGELEGRVPESVRAGLDPARLYGVSYHGRVAARKVSNAKREQRKTDPETWIGAPVDLTGSGLKADVIDRARSAMEGNFVPRKVGDRFFVLAHGLLRCHECGRGMVGYARRHENRPPNFYYRCDAASRTNHKCPNRRSRRAPELEEKAWEMVGFEATDSEGELVVKLAAAYEEKKRRLRGGGAAGRAALVEALQKIETRRDGLYDLAADGDIPKEVLRRKLGTLEEDEGKLRAELDATRDAAEGLAELERSYRTVLQLLEDRRVGVEVEETPEARRRRYQRMGITFTVDSEGTLRAEWSLQTSDTDTATSIGSLTSAGLCEGATHP